jgi:hypothetical protein
MMRWKIPRPHLRTRRHRHRAALRRLAVANERARIKADVERRLGVSEKQRLGRVEGGADVERKLAVCGGR